MSRHTAGIEWSRDGHPFVDNRYSRAHRWSFDGGVVVPASSSPAVVPLPMSSAQAVDPEEAFVASLAACHMLWFLSLAARHAYCVDGYEDDAVGEMGRDETGALAMVRVTLRPRVRFGGANVPDAATHEELHHQAHARCFLANSVKTVIECRPELIAQ
jgi:organic hydroperoxide reductase OsmC/OhrA